MTRRPMNPVPPVTMTRRDMIGYPSPWGRRARMPRGHLTQEFCAIHPRHPHVAHDDIRGARGQQFQRLGAGLSEAQVPLLAQAQELPTQAAQDLGFVIHEQDVRFAVCAHESSRWGGEWEAG